ncbi:ABC-2 type transport system permease protein [Actinocorallia herbida]|uniref:ABC-2 type transport system permease protein n=1 Tax=Actinocorallia herbida TaxID=58109 RepID=A0A3N1DCA5_9ACTN|nr:ABC transporter permease [Actinocorallia herbida]ROO91164.1 ABC-2 type transport system permease protein [Actinocorallia herbida]
MNSTIVALTLRGVLGRRRAILLFLLPVVLLALATGLAATGYDTLQTATDVLHAFGIVVLLPLLALIVGTGVIGPEIDEGQIMYVLTKPIARTSVVLTKYVCAVGLLAAFAALPVWLAGVLMLGPGSDVPWAFAVGALQSGVVYGAVFLALAVVSRNAVTIGLIYALVWESMIGGFVAGSRNLSVQSWGLSTVDALTSATTVDIGSSVTTGLILSVITTVVALAFAISKLRTLTLASAD